jgi:hypothetical protein
MLNVTISKEVVGYSYSAQGPGGDQLTKKAIGLPVVLPIFGLKGRY